MGYFNKSHVNKYISYSVTFKALVQMFSKSCIKEVSQQMYGIAESLQKELTRENLCSKKEVNTKDYLYRITVLNEEQTKIQITVKHKVIKYYNDIYFFEYYGTKHPTM